MLLCFEEGEEDLHEKAEKNFLSPFLPLLCFALMGKRQKAWGKLLKFIGFVALGNFSLPNQTPRRDMKTKRKAPLPLARPLINILLLHIILCFKKVKTKYLIDLINIPVTVINERERVRELVRAFHPPGDRGKKNISIISSSLLLTAL
jgi:hypothetical protein